MGFKECILLFFSLAIAHNCMGQFIGKGIVMDTLNKNISNATIQIRNNSTNKLLKATTTDSLGTFIIELKNDLPDTTLLSITVTHIAFETVSEIVSVKKWKTEIKNIYLKQGSQTTLQEVLVKSLPISIIDDTTTFRIKAFIDGTEKTLEDVAKKLPGLIVNEDGSIVFKGKRLTSILIEGEDLLSNKTKLLSKNFPADLLDNIQLIENYNNNSLLKGFSQGDQTIMNLKLNKRKLKIVFGELGATVGMPDRRDINLVLFSLLNITKSATIAKYNNIGKDDMQSAGLSIDSDDMMQKISNFSYQTLVSIPDNTIKPFIASVPLPTQRWFFNNQLNFSNQTNLKFFKKSFVKILTSYQRDNPDLSTIKKSFFFQQGNDFEVNDTLQTKFRPEKLKVKIQADIPISSKKQGRLILQFEADYTKFNTVQSINQLGVSAFNSGNLRNSIKTGFVLYDYTHRKSDNRILLSNSYLSIKTIPQQYFLSSNKFGVSLLGINTYNNFIQHNLLNEYILGHQFQILTKKNNAINSPYVNLQLEETNRKNFLSIRNDSTDIKYQPSNQADKNNIIKMTLGFQKTLKYYKTKVTQTIEAGTFYWQNLTSGKSKKESTVTGKIETSIQHKFSKLLTTSLTSSYEKKYNNNHLLNDSISLYNNTDLIRYSVNRLTSNKFEINYGLFYMSQKLLLLTLNGGFSYQPNGIVASNTLASSINFINNEFVNQSNILNFLALQAKSPIIKLQSRIELTTTLIHQKTPYYESQNEYSAFNSNSITSEIKYTTVFKTKINGDIGIRNIYNSSFRLFKKISQMLSKTGQ